MCLCFIIVILFTVLQVPVLEQFIQYVNCNTHYVIACVCVYIYIYNMSVNGICTCM